LSPDCRVQTIGLHQVRMTADAVEEKRAAAADFS
jgi:hypothetical protein